MRKFNRESGQTLVLVAVGFTALLGFVAFSTDVGMVLHEKRNVQIAADAAALAAAGTLNYGTAGANAAGQAAATQNGFTNGSNGATVTINTNGSITVPLFNTAGHAQATVTQVTFTPFIETFMHLFNPHSSYSGMSVSATAIAQNGVNNQEQCFDALSPTGSGNTTDPGADVYFSGAANLTSPNCGIQDDSNASNALAMNGAFNADFQSIGVVGGDSISGAINWTGAQPVLDQNSFSDPLNYLDADEPTLPSPLTSTNCPTLSYSGATIATISPGCYQGISISGSAIITFDPGLYTITGSTGLNISGAANVSQASGSAGSGVTFYLTNGASVDLGSGAYNVTLAAPTTGTWNGILFFENPSDTAPFDFSGAANLNLQGIIYLPSANVSWTGAANGTLYTDFVVSTFSDTGALNLTDYAAVNAADPLVHLSVALVY
jgi:Flp pilus assembly protein TadG